VCPVRTAAIDVPAPLIEMDEADLALEEIAGVPGLALARRMTMEDEDFVSRALESCPRAGVTGTSQGTDTPRHPSGHQAGRIPGRRCTPSGPLPVQTTVHRPAMRRIVVTTIRRSARSIRPASWAARHV
jgi:hypothetical protein